MSGVPSWVMKQLPAFAAAGEQVRATTALRLSRATRLLLAELPVVEPPAVAEATAPAQELCLEGLGGTLLPFQVG